mgnify:FL=1
MNNYGFQSEPENSFHENYNLYHDKRSQSFATAGFVLGLIAALTPYFVFTSLICGPLAIIFGLLSKGGEMTMDTKGKVAVILGIIGLVLTVLIILVAFRVVILDEFGGFENFLKYYQINSPSSSDMI